jgi:tetratricopeptide (TPR) repeat protein
MVEIERQSAAALIDRGEAREAISRLKSALEQYPDDRRLVLLLARAYLVENNLFWAERTLRAALDQRPDDPELRAWLAAVHLRQGDPELAETDLDPAYLPAEDPDLARWHLLDASRARLLGDADASTAAPLAAIDVLYPEDRPIWAGLMRATDPWWTPAVSGTVDLGFGRTSNALAGSPTDPGVSGKPSNLIRPEIRGRFIPPTRGSAKPAFDLEVLGNGLLADEYRDLSTLLVGLRLGGVVDTANHRWNFGYRAEVLLIDEDFSLFSEAHRGEAELEWRNGRVVFAGTGHRSYRDERRTRWEADLGFGSPFRLSSRIPALFGTTVRLADATSPAYDQVGISAAASSALPLARNTALWIALSAIWDDYPNSGGIEGLRVFGTTEKRRDLLGRVGVTLWTPGWRSLRPGVELRYTARNSTADETPGFDFSYREFRAVVWLRWTIAADPWAPKTIRDPDHVPLDWGLKEQEGLDQERIIDLLRRDEELRRGSSCSFP